jgi:tetratricopeptide (TPR) repeat protein
VLPQELDDAHFLVARPENDTRLIDALQGELLQLAQLLTVAEGLLTPALLAALKPCAEEDAGPALEELVRLGVLVGAEGGYRFAQEALRRELGARMHGTERDAAHARYGRQLGSVPFASQLDELVSACHRVHDPADHAAQRAVAVLCLRYVLREPDLLSVLVPHLERVVALYRQRGHRGRELLPLLSALGVAAYYSDRAILERYGEELLEGGAELLGLRRARRLQRWLGRKLGLFVALAIAGAGFARQRKNPRVPAFKESLMALFACVGAICGVYTICIDPRRALQVADILEPMTALGPQHTASLLYEFAKNLGHTVQDDIGAAYLRWQRMVARLDRPEGIPGVDDLIRYRYLYGGLYAMGVLECWRDGEGGLAIADRLEQSNIALYRLSADQLRSVFYANRGNLARYEHYRGRAELHAVKRGTAWQVEVWSPMAAITPCQRLYDVMGMKHAVEQLERLARSVESLNDGLSRARGTYELLRKRYEAALAELIHVEREVPRYVVGWGRMCGALARCYNALGRHAEGLAVAERAVAHLTPEDRTFASMNLGLELERVYALVGLREAERAEGHLEELERLHAASENPITRGALAEARVRLALARRDEQAARAAYTDLETHYLGTAAPSLVARVEGVGRELERTFAVHVARTFSDAPATHASTGVGVTVIEHALSELAPVERRMRALGLVLKAAQSERGALCLVEGGAPRVCSASHGFRLPKELSDWLLTRVRALQDEQLEATESDDGDVEDPNLCELGRTRYRLLPLRCTDSDHDGLLGAVVVEEAQIGAAMVSPYVLEAVARRLREPASTVVSALE